MNVRAALRVRAPLHRWLAAVLLGLLVAAVPAGAQVHDARTRAAHHPHVHDHRPARRPRAAAAADDGSSGDLLGSVSHVERTAAHIALDLTLVALALGALTVAPLVGLFAFTRRRARRDRRYVRLRLVPYRADEAEPAEVQRLLESFHQQLLERWWVRLLRGQPSMALELSMDGDDAANRAAVVTLVCPEHMRRGVEGALRSCYPDVRVEPHSAPLPDVQHIIRLKKRFHFVNALRAPSRVDYNAVDVVLNQMEMIGEPAVVQRTIVPTPALFDRYSRWRYTKRERSHARARSIDPGSPGLQSEVLSHELEAGLQVQHHPLFFTDIRVGAATRDGVASLSGAVRAEAGAENRLVERWTRSRRGIYVGRLHAAVGNPVPSWRRGVLSSVELSVQWRLPSPGLRSVRLGRSPLPRMPAAPDVTRDPAYALARDEHGLVGILPQDKSDGLGLIGGQKTGKTSVLCRTVEADAADPNCALVVLMPKPGDATKALSMVPPGRTVHYLDLEHPELGINPLLGDGDPASVADRVVDAFRDVNMEGDIRGSSDRYLRQAAQAAIGASRAGALDGPPTLWHMYRILMPGEVAFREHVVSAIYPDPRFADTATFFGSELPIDLRDSTATTTAKLDAPRNKLLRLLIESLDKVLRHPRQLSLDEVIRNREVLIVDGKMGTFGADNCRVMMQFILNALYAALQRQQQLPEDQRTRVALKVDEAHLILNESFADAMATLRSAGLEVVAAWQYGEQIQDPKIRGGMMSLLRQRCMFSMGETADARDMSSVAMSVYSDMIRADKESRAQLRVTPDTIFNLPNHHAVCSWISGGARQPAFVAQTMPLETDDAVIAAHLEAQRARGGFVPERLPDPLPDVAFEGIRDLPSEQIVDPPRATEFEFDPSGTSLDDANRRDEPATPKHAPESFAELDLSDVRGIIWDKVAPTTGAKVPEPTQRELEILAALWSYRFLFASQIWRRWWAGSSQRASQQALNRMAKAGWVKRFKFQLGERGAQQRVYVLTRLGFDVALGRIGPRGAYIAADSAWREPQISDPRRVIRDLRVNGWAMALEASFPRAVAGWRGPREGRLNPPRRKVRGEWLDIKPSEILVGANTTLRDFELPKFEPVSPDATIELRIPLGDTRMRLDLLIEMDRGRSMAASEDRLRRYDGLISGWASMLDRYQSLGTPPAVVFLAPDEPTRERLIRIADRVVTARLAKPGTGESEWPHPGRNAMFFAVEAAMHNGSLEAQQLPLLAPDVRVRLQGRRAKALEPRKVRIVDPRLLTRR